MRGARFVALLGVPLMLAAAWVIGGSVLENPKADLGDVIVVTPRGSPAPTPGARPVGEPGEQGPTEAVVPSSSSPYTAEDTSSGAVPGVGRREPGATKVSPAPAPAVDDDEDDPDRDADDEDTDDDTGDDGPGDDARDDARDRGRG